MGDGQNYKNQCVENHIDFVKNFQSSTTLKVSIKVIGTPIVKIDQNSESQKDWSISFCQKSLPMASCHATYGVLSMDTKACGGLG